MDIQELRAEWQKLFEAEQDLELQKGKLLQQFRRVFKQEPDWPKNWCRFLRSIGLSKTKAYRLMQVASFYQKKLPL